MLWRSGSLPTSGTNVDQATQAVLRVTRSVLERLDVDIVLERVLEAARELTGARYAALGVLDDSRTELARFLALGIDESTRRMIGPLPTGRGVLGELIRDPKPLRLADVGSHPYSYGFPTGHPPMRTFLGVPILVADRPYGNLYLTKKEGGRSSQMRTTRLRRRLVNLPGSASSTTQANSPAPTPSEPTSNGRSAPSMPRFRSPVPSVAKRTSNRSWNWSPSVAARSSQRERW